MSGTKRLLEQVSERVSSSPPGHRPASGGGLVAPGRWSGGWAPGSPAVSSGRAVRKRVPKPAIKDADGLDLRPDPLQARTAAELVGAMRRFHQWAGEPSYRVMAEQCGQMVSASSLHRALTSRALPPFSAVMALITGCGGSEEDKSRFASAWRRIRSGRAAGDRPQPALRALPPAAAKTG